MPLRDKLRFGPLAPDDDEFDLFQGKPDDAPPAEEGDDRAVAGSSSEAKDAERAGKNREHTPSTR